MMAEPAGPESDASPTIPKTASTTAPAAPVTAPTTSAATPAAPVTLAAATTPTALAAPATPPAATVTAAGVPATPRIKEKRPTQRACDEKNEKGKVCCGHLKRWYDYPPEIEKLIGKKTEIYRCEFCQTLYKPDLAEMPHSYTLRY